MMEQIARLSEGGLLCRRIFARREIPPQLRALPQAGLPEMETPMELPLIHAHLTGPR